MMINRRELWHPILALVTLPILSLTAIGQPQPTVLWQVSGGRGCGVDDLNGDGVPDVAVNSSAGLGIHSGVDGALLFPLPYPNGGNVAYAGDVDGDQVGDIIVGLPFFSGGSFLGGQVDILSGATLTVVHTFTMSGSGIEFGHKVANAGDVNADGVPDTLVGAPGPIAGGFARVYSGSTGSQLYHFSAATGLLHDIDRAGDVNGDGYDDVIVGEGWGSIPAGAVYVFSGFDGSIIHTITWPVGYTIANSVSGLGDINGDGFSDFVIGSGSNFIGGAFLPGFARVYSGLNASVLYTFTGVAGANLGSHSNRAGDIDGDGTQDIILSASWCWNSNYPVSYVDVYSGATGVLLASIPPVLPVTCLGSFVGPARDLDQDGFDDVLIHGDTASGGVFYAYSLAAPGTLTPLGPPMIGSQLGIQLASPFDAGRPYVCGFALGGAPGIPLPNGRVVPLNPDWLLAFSLMPANPFFLGTVGTLDVVGGGTVTMAIPPEPLLVGATIQGAFAVGNPSAPWGIGTISAALPITFQ